MKKLLTTAALALALMVPISANAVVECPTYAIGGATLSTGASMAIAGGAVTLAELIILANVNGVDFPVCANTIAPGMKPGLVPVASCDWSYTSYSENLTGNRLGQGQ